MKNLLQIFGLVFVTLAFCLAQAAMDDLQFHKKTEEILNESEKYLVLKSKKDQQAALKSIFVKIKALEKENPQYEGLSRLTAVKAKDAKLFEQELKKEDKKFQEYVEEAMDVREGEKLEEEEN